MRALIWPDQADSSVHSISSLDRYRTHFVDQYQGISCVQKHKLRKLTISENRQSDGQAGCIENFNINQDCPAKLVYCLILNRKGLDTCQGIMR